MTKTEISPVLWTHVSLVIFDVEICCVIVPLLQACERLLEMRVAAKLRGSKVDDFINRLHVAVPAKRDSKVCSSSYLGCNFFLIIRLFILGSKLQCVLEKEFI